MTKARFVIRSQDIADNACTHLLTHWQMAIKAGKPLQVTIEAKAETRHLVQNARYWVIVNGFQRFASEAGLYKTPDHWHERFKCEFLGWQMVDGFPVVESTTGLSVAEFAKYMTAVEAHLLTEYGYQVPADPRIAAWMRDDAAANPDIF